LAIAVAILRVANTNFLVLFIIVERTMLDALSIKAFLSILTAKILSHSHPYGFTLGIE